MKQRVEEIRKSKIMATVGPASEAPETLRALVEAGAQIFRLNFSHGTPKHHLEILQEIRRIETETGKILAVLQDLPGPKVRIGPIQGTSLRLEKGQIFYLYEEERLGTSEGVQVRWPGFSKGLKPGDRIFLGDGDIELEVQDPGPPTRTLVRKGGVLLAGKGVTFADGPKLPSLTDRDRELLELGIRAGFDGIALSYVQTPEDLEDARKLLEKADQKIMLFAKIERREALSQLEDIVDLADGIIVARGDLGIAIPLVQLPFEQRRIIRIARRKSKPVFVATQTMASMVDHARPTRAEVTDVFQAAMDGADGILLSEETAIGSYPVETVQWAHQIFLEAERHLAFPTLHGPHDDPNEILAEVCVTVSSQLSTLMIVTPTYSGSTALRVAKRRPKVPILALTPRKDTARWLTFAYGVLPVLSTVKNFSALEEEAQAWIQQHIQIDKPGFLIFLLGLPMERPGITNTLAIRECPPSGPPSKTPEL